MAPITVKPSEEKWSIRCCFFCNGPLLGEERILKCMHFICKTCLGVREIDSSVYCLCNVVTTKDFINVNCPLRILTKPGMCSFHANCMNEATKKCRTCKIFFCDDCGKRHVNVEHGDNFLNRLMEFNLGKKYSVTCKVCTNSEAKTYCIECSKALCSGCSMHCYLVHTQENIDTLSKKSKLELLKTKSDLKQVVKNIIDCTEQTKDHYKILEVQKQEAYTVIEQKVEEAYKQIEDLKHLLKQSVDDYVLKCSEEVGECQMHFKDLKLKSNYYINLTEHILKDLPSHKCYKLSVIFKDKLINAENSFERILKEISQINICFGIKWEKVI